MNEYTRKPEVVNNPVPLYIVRIVVRQGKFYGNLDYKVSGLGSSGLVEAITLYTLGRKPFVNMASFTYSKNARDITLYEMTLECPDNGDTSKIKVDQEGLKGLIKKAYFINEDE